MTKTQVFAILRLANFYDSNITMDDLIKVKGIVWTFEEAQAEVDRLSKLNESKNCRYLIRTTLLSNKD